MYLTATRAGGQEHCVGEVVKVGVSIKMVQRRKILHEWAA